MTEKALAMIHLMIWGRLCLNNDNLAVRMPIDGNGILLIVLVLFRDADDRDAEDLECTSVD